MYVISLRSKGVNAPRLGGGDGDFSTSVTPDLIRGLPVLKGKRRVPGQAPHDDNYAATYSAASSTGRPACHFSRIMSLVCRLPSWLQPGSRHI